MMNYPNPCENCPTGCYDTNRGAKECVRYRTWINTWWKHFNGYVTRVRAQKKPESTKFFYEHPDIVRRYLMNGPCEGCKREKACDTPCGAYWRWWDARQEWHRNRLK